MSEKGQVVTLDMIVALIIIVLAVAYMVQTIEIQQHSALSEMSYMRLKDKAIGVGNLLVGNPDNQCELVDANGRIMMLPGTVTTELITKQSLGLTEDYRCNIDGLATECNDILQPEIKDVFIEKRKVLVCFASATPGQVTTAELKAARNTTDLSGIGGEREVTITLWR